MKEIFKIQQLLNYLLYSFLTSTSLTYAGVLFYPLLNKVARHNRFKSQVEELGKLCKGQDWGGLENLCQRYSDKGETRVLMEAISCGYARLGENIPRGKTPFEIEIPPSIEEKSDASHTLIQRIINMADYVRDALAEDLLLMVVHESFAYGDFVPGYSDCDTFAIIKKEVVESPKRLMELRTKMVKVPAFFYGIDPFQHHGVLVCSEHDLDSYPLAFLPPHLITAGSLICSSVEKENIKGFLNHEEGAALEEFKKRVKVTRGFLGRKGLNLFQMKNLLSNLVMLPVNFYELKDRSGLGKVEALQRFQEEFPKHKPFLEALTQIRADWPKHRGTPLGLWGAAFRLNPELFKLAYGLLNAKVDPWILEILGSGDWRSNFLDMIEEMEKIVD